MAQVLGDCAPVVGTLIVPGDCRLRTVCCVDCYSEHLSLLLIFDTLLFRLTEHVQDKSKLPILIFPEGECNKERSTRWRRHLEIAPHLCFLLTQARV